jgi:hypothetical protein
MPAAAAIAGRCSVWLVDPPVASRPTTPLTTVFSLTSSPIGVHSFPSAVSSVTRRAAAAVSASRSGVPGLTKLDPGRCSPMISIIIWLVFAVP